MLRCFLLYTKFFVTINVCSNNKQKSGLNNFDIASNIFLLFTQVKEPLKTVPLHKLNYVLKEIPDEFFFFFFNSY